MAEGRTVVRRGIKCPCDANAYKEVKSLSHSDSEQDWFKISHARCRDQEGNQFDVVLKIFDLDKNPTETLDDIQKEVAVMRKCSHDNIVRLYACFVHGEDLWMVLDYMNRGSCRDQLRLRFLDGFPEDVVNCVLAQTLGAIEYLHSQDMIHRDIKADNLLIDSSYRVKVTDFWISSVGNEGAKKKAMTFIGTPCWMAPEVIEQEQGYDCKADIWSFGITLLELANGKAPFEGQKPLKVLKSILRLNPPQLEGNFSSELKKVCEVCLQKEPTTRPQASELREVSIFKNAQLPRTCELIELGAIMSAEQTAKTPRLSLETEEWTFDDWSALDTMTERELNRSVEELVESSQSDSMTIEQLSANEIPVLDNFLVGDGFLDEKPQMNGLHGESLVTSDGEASMNGIPHHQASPRSSQSQKPSRNSFANGLDVNGFPELDTTVDKNPLPESGQQNAFDDLAHSPVQTKLSPKPSPKPSPKLGSKSPKINGKWGRGAGQRRSVSFANMPELDIASDTNSPLSRLSSSPNPSPQQQMDTNGPSQKFSVKLDASGDSLLSDSSGGDISNFVITEDSPGKQQEDRKAGQEDSLKLSQSDEGTNSGQTKADSNDVWSELEKMLNEPTSPRTEKNNERRGSITKISSPMNESAALGPNNGHAVHPYVPPRPSPQLASQTRNDLSVRVPAMPEDRQSSSPANRHSAFEKSHSVKELHSNYTSPKPRTSLDVPSRHSMDIDGSAFSRFDWQRPSLDGEAAAHAGTFEFRKNQHNKKFVITDLEGGAKSALENGPRGSHSPPRSPVRQTAPTIAENTTVVKEKPTSAARAAHDPAPVHAAANSGESTETETEALPSSLKGHRTISLSELPDQSVPNNAKAAITQGNFSSSTNNLTSAPTKPAEGAVKTPKFVIKDAPDGEPASIKHLNGPTTEVSGKPPLPHPEPQSKNSLDVIRAQSAGAQALDTSKIALQPANRQAPANNKPRSPDSDEGGGVDLESFDSAQLRDLVRRLQGQVSQLKTENLTLQQEKRELEKRSAAAPAPEP